MNFAQKTYTPEEVRDAVVRHILREYQNAGLIKSDTEYDRMRIRLESELSGGNLISQPIDIDGKIKAEDYNKIFYDLYIDMLTVFEKMNLAGDKLEEHKRLHQSIIANNNIRLSVLSDDLAKLEERLFNASDDYSYIESFRTADSFETDPALYTDESGQLMSPHSFVSYNKYSEFITLTRSVEINKITHFNGVKMAELRINKQLGSGLISIKNPLNRLNKAIDTSMASYWEETIMAEEPFKIELGREYWYNSFGALCELEVIFGGPVDITEIALIPYGAYPLEVVAIKRYLSDDPDDEEYTYPFDYQSNGTKVIVSPDSHVKILRSVIAKDYVLYQFERTRAKRLRIILNQRHYIRTSCIIEKSDAEKTQLWFNDTEALKVTLKARQTGIYQDKSLLDRLWLMMSQKIYKLDILHIKDWLFPKIKDKVPIMRFEYNYGLYNLACNEVDYAYKSVYVSKPIYLNHNIASIWLTVDETVPTDIARCDILYFITTELRPARQDHWYPIIPSNRSNGNPDLREIDFKEMLRQNQLNAFISREVYISSKNRSIKLNHLPFVIYGSGAPGVYFRLAITHRHGRDVRSQDITDYYNPTAGSPRFTDRDIYQYFVYKDQVYFNQAIPSGYKIEITYRHFIDMVRLKAVFTTGEGNTQSRAEEHLGITPVLKQYKLHYRILE